MKEGKISPIGEQPNLNAFHKQENVLSNFRSLNKASSESKIEDLVCLLSSIPVFWNIKHNPLGISDGLERASITTSHFPERLKDRSLTDDKIDIAMAMTHMWYYFCN